MAIESIAKTLGTGSGIDIGELVGGLVDAQFANKTATLDRRDTALAAQISAAADLKNAISGFSSALAALARNGSLSTQPTTSDSSVLKASTLSGATPGAIDATIEVRQIASAQASNSAPRADRTAAIGTGTLTLTFGSATVVDGEMTVFNVGPGTPIDIAIDAANSSLDGIAAAINAKGAGITASILSDSAGSRLILKGATGDSQAFTLTADTPALAALDVGVGKTGTTIGTTAQDAIVAVDGVTLRRASNSISNIIEGVRLDLVSAKPGTSVRLGTQAPTAGLTQAVEDFVATFNELQNILRTATDPMGGALRSDSAASALQRSLRQLITAPLTTGGAAGSPSTLAQIGVGTQRDGSLQVDAAVLARAMASDPAAIEAMFASGSGLPAALSAVATAATSRTTGLGASEARYTAQQGDLADERLDIAEASEQLRTRMTQQFASMDAKVAAYKSQQDFLTQQIDAWNSQD
ncbi:flagellar filament capping protein FliD [Sphingomonas qomolangmaensis]|uniref:Flagellar hook-associated protein 2 n=1 Tax=Sphingomonas qomolangmaensis TaxID=2918765 RepID=A0ABY5L8X6_9SPHN|nr:flagellar filament capping protein FliD [Sphingomonas qomolangmaensis]UUL82249.1 flagellar filament capping protein FliD [Sphingomonas qomolangmaensis]